jgi:hypothetical protein
MTSSTSDCAFQNGDRFQVLTDVNGREDICAPYVFNLKRIYLRFMYVAHTCKSVTEQIVRHPRHVSCKLRLEIDNGFTFTLIKTTMRFEQIRKYI